MLTKNEAHRLAIKCYVQAEVYNVLLVQGNLLTMYLKLSTFQKRKGNCWYNIFWHKVDLLLPAICYVQPFHTEQNNSLQYA